MNNLRILIKKCCKLSSEKVLEQFINIHNDLYIYEYDVNGKLIYINNHIDIKIICKIYREFYQTPNNHKTGRGCYECGLIKISNKKKLTQSDVIEQFKYIHCDRYDYNYVIYINDKTKVIIKCNICNYIFLQTPSGHKQNRGCSKCNKSKICIKLENIFENIEVEFNVEKKFDDLRDIKKLRYDYYLIKYNLLIECDGGQHFKAIKYFGEEEQFKKQICHGKLKNKYAIENKINLLRIKYTEINKIEQLIKNTIKIIENDNQYYRYFLDNEIIKLIE